MRQRSSSRADSSPLKRRMFTYLAGLGTAVLVWWLFNLAMPEPADLVPQRLTVRGAPGSVAETLAAHIAAPITQGNSVELLENGNEIFPAMLQEIRAADSTVNFLTYVYWTGEIAEEFSEALAQASLRGVEVRVLLDGYGASKIRGEVVQRMEDAGCQVAWFHPFSWYHLRHFNNRTHRKVLVVDGDVGFTGGVGIAEEWTGDAQDEGHWRDDHFRVTGPAVASLQMAFAENWTTSTGEVLAGAGFFPHIEGGQGAQQPGNAQVVPIITSPRGDRSVIAYTYWLLLENAARSVDIATPYFVPDASLVDVIQRTAERGVRVRLLVPGEHNDSRFVRWASLALYQGLIDAGVEIYEYEPTMMHTKLLLVDDRHALIGSANFDNRSFELNDEISLLVDDPEFSAELVESFARDLEAARRVESQSFVSPKWWKRLAGHASLVLREQL